MANCYCEYCCECSPELGTCVSYRAIDAEVGDAIRHTADKLRIHSHPTQGEENAQLLSDSFKLNSQRVFVSREGSRWRFVMSSEIFVVLSFRPSLVFSHSLYKHVIKDTPLCARFFGRQLLLHSKLFSLHLYQELWKKSVNASQKDDDPLDVTAVYSLNVAIHRRR